MIESLARIGPRALVALTWVLALAPPAAGLQTVPFKGRVLVIGAGSPPRQMKVRLGQFGSHPTNDGGYFVAAIPVGTRSLDIQVETGDPKWVMRYPLGPVPVPADTSFITSVIVGPSIEESLARAYAVDNAQLRERLKAAGIRDSQVLATLAGIRREFADRTRLEADDLGIAAQREFERTKEYPRIAAALEDYVIKAHNVHTAFRIILQFAFTNDSAFAELKKGIRQYNDAFETLKTGRTSFEQTVAQYWGNDRISSDLRALLDYALGEIHAIHILPLNDVLADISAVAKGQVKGEQAKQKKQLVTQRVSDTLRALDPRLQELDRRKDRLLSDLQAL